MSLAQNIRSASTFKSTAPGWLMLTNGVGLGVQNWINAQSSNAMLVGVCPVGPAGAGMISSGKVICPPMPPLVIGACLAAGMKGVKMVEMATAISIGFSNTINQSAYYRGSVAGVSGGVDIAKVVVSNSPKLVKSIHTGFKAMGMKGVLLPMLATGIGNGIALNLALGFGIGAITPVTPAPAVAAGSSPSNMIS